MENTRLFSWAHQGFFQTLSKNSSYTVLKYTFIFIISWLKNQAFATIILRFELKPPFWIGALKNPTYDFY